MCVWKTQSQTNMQIFSCFHLLNIYDIKYTFVGVKSRSSKLNVAYSKWYCPIFECILLLTNLIWVHYLQHVVSLQWRHHVNDGVSNHRGLDGFVNCLFRRRSKRISNLCVSGLCKGNSPVTGGFPSKSASNAESVSRSLRHNVACVYWTCLVDGWYQMNM